MIIMAAGPEEPEVIVSPINHPDEKTGLLAQPTAPDASVRSAFFLLGAGSTIRVTFNAAVMAVAYCDDRQQQRPALRSASGRRGYMWCV